MTRNCNNWRSDEPHLENISKYPNHICPKNCQHTQLSHPRIRQLKRRLNMGNCNQPFAFIKIRGHKTHRILSGSSIIWRHTTPKANSEQNLRSLFHFQPLNTMQTDACKGGNQSRCDKKGFRLAYGIQHGGEARYALCGRKG